MKEEEENSGDNKPAKGQDGDGNQNLNPIDKLIEKQSTIDSIFEGLNALTQKQTASKKKKAPIIELISGQHLDVNVLASEWQHHKPQYHEEFYTPVFRLLDISGDPSSFTARFDKRIADFKNEVIWGRFEKSSFETLRRKNKYSGYFVRKNWHYQGLNDKGIDDLQTYIRQAIEVMNESTTYYEFRKKMYERYGLGYQSEIHF